MAAQKIEINPNGRRCTACGQFKGWENFRRAADGLNGRESQCGVCRDAANTRAKLRRKQSGRSNRATATPRMLRIINLVQRLHYSMYTGFLPWLCPGCLLAWRRAGLLSALPEEATDHEPFYDAYEGVYHDDSMRTDEMTGVDEMDPAGI